MPTLGKMKYLRENLYLEFIKMSEVNNKETSVLIKVGKGVVRQSTSIRKGPKVAYTLTYLYPATGTDGMIF